MRDVFDDAEVELGGRDIGMSIFDLGGFFFGADGGYYSVAVLEENVEDMSGDKSTSWSRISIEDVAD